MNRAAWHCQITFLASPTSYWVFGNIFLLFCICTIFSKVADAFLCKKARSIRKRHNDSTQLRSDHSSLTRSFLTFLTSFFLWSPDLSYGLSWRLTIRRKLLVSEVSTRLRGRNFGRSSTTQQNVTRISGLLQPFPTWRRKSRQQCLSTTKSEKEVICCWTKWDRIKFSNPMTICGSVAGTANTQVVQNCVAFQRLLNYSEKTPGLGGCTVSAMHAWNTRGTL